MERNNGRYPYIRRQGSGNGPHSHHHHNNANSSSGASSSTSSSSSSASVTNTSHNTQQYSNNSINNATTTNTNTHYVAAVSQQQQQQQLQQQQQSVPISQHDELIRYIREAWNKVSEQGTPVIYCNESDNQLKNFKPFNLEEYWGQRLVQNIHVTTTHQ